MRAFSPSRTGSSQYTPLEVASMSQRWQTRYLPAVICVFLGLLLLKSPQLAVRGFTSGLYLCTNTVLPALFPFFVLCDLLLSCPMEEKFLRPFTTCFGLQSSRGALTVLLSWFGGYAVCAQLVGTLRRGNQLDARDSGAPFARKARGRAFSFSQSARPPLSSMGA